jgi:hypothetical protein
MERNLALTLHMIGTLLCLLNKRMTQQPDYPWPTDSLVIHRLEVLDLNLPSM